MSKVNACEALSLLTAGAMFSVYLPPCWSFLGSLRKMVCSRVHVAVGPGAVGSADLRLAIRRHGVRGRGVLLVAGGDQLIVVRVDGGGRVQRRGKLVDHLAGAVASAVKRVWPGAGVLPLDLAIVPVDHDDFVVHGSDLDQLGGPGRSTEHADAQDQTRDGQMRFQHAKTSGWNGASCEAIRTEGDLQQPWGARTALRPPPRGPTGAASEVGWGIAPPFQA